MRNSRSIRKRIRRKKIGLLELDITSLLDILVIMLVFLLKSYNASGVIINVPKGVVLPTSASSLINSTGTMIQVSETKIWVDDDLVYDKENPPARTFDHRGKRIIPLYNELVKKKELIKRVHKSAERAKKFTGRVNLIIDKTLKYSYIKKLMYTSAEAGFRQYKFIVMGEEQ
jgi:biopolymer transport protein ExbD